MEVAFSGNGDGCSVEVLVGSIQSHTSALFHLLEERLYSSLFLMNNQSDAAGFDHGFSLLNVAG